MREYARYEVPWTGDGNGDLKETKARMPWAGFCWG